MWLLFNPVVRFRVMPITRLRFIFDPRLHVQLRRTNVGNNGVPLYLWKENPFQDCKAIEMDAVILFPQS